MDAEKEFARLSGTLYIDGGKPLPSMFAESLRNLKEIAPKFYVNVPFGYSMLADALDKDEELRWATTPHGHYLYVA